jgi:putative endonuclease
MSWVCYLLRCADDTEKRLAAHNAGEGAKYTRGRTPVSVVYCESCEDKSAALKRELQIKRLPRSAKQVLMQDGIINT